jgi:hypothetical protein
LDKAEVRIPYTELRKLWDEAQSAKTAVPPEPLPEGLLLAALFRADLSSGKVGLEAEFRVESFAGKWERLPLMGAGMSVASVDPPDARLVVQGDQLYYVAPQEGPATIKVRFTDTALPGAGGSPFLTLVTLPSAVGALELRGLPADRAVLLADGTPAPGQMEDGVLRLSLPATGGPIALSLTDVALLPKAEVPPPPLPPVTPSDWSLQNEVLVFEGEGELCYQVRVNASALNGSAVEAVLMLPPQARSVKVEGDDLAESRPARTAEGLTELRLKWKTRDIMERQLTLSYAVQQMPLSPEWALRGPALPNEGPVKTLFMFPLTPGLEFSGTGLQGPVLAQKLPQWVRSESKAPEFGTVAAATHLTLQSRVLPRLETAVGVITRSEYNTKLVGDGSALTTASIDIEHDEALRWSLSLPEKSELLKCAVDGATVKPIARENGVVEIPLPYAGSNAKSVKSVVTFSYTEVKEKLAAVEGQTALELPLTPLFIQEVLWTVEIPESYQISGVGEGIEHAPGTGPSNAHSVRLIRRLCRNERPRADLFYQKGGLVP